MIKVLVVEDEPLLLMLACDIVQELGFDFLGATNADDAVKLLEEYPEVRILMTDIDMPGSMDGLKLAAAVRERWPLVQIVVVSGNSGRDAVIYRRKASSSRSPTTSDIFWRPWSGWPPSMHLCVEQKPLDNFMAAHSQAG